MAERRNPRKKKVEAPEEKPTPVFESTCALPVLIDGKVVLDIHLRIGAEYTSVRVDIDKYALDLGQYLLETLSRQVAEYPEHAAGLERDRKARVARSGP